MKKKNQPNLAGFIETKDVQFNVLNAGLLPVENKAVAPETDASVPPVAIVEDAVVETKAEKKAAKKAAAEVVEEAPAADDDAK